MVTVILKASCRGREQVLFRQRAEGRAEESQGPGGEPGSQLRSQRKTRGKKPCYCSCSALVFLRELLLPPGLSLLRQGAICPGSCGPILAEGDRIFIWAWGHRGLWAWYRPKVQTGTMTFGGPQRPLRTKLCHLCLCLQSTPFPSFFRSLSSRHCLHKSTQILNSTVLKWEGLSSVQGKEAPT